MSSNRNDYSLDVPVEEAPSTVISLIPGITESLFDLSLGNRLIARTEESIFPVGKVDAIPVIGSMKHPDIERIIQLAPELVVANLEENRPEDINAIQSAGIPVWVTFPRTVQDVFNLLWNVMYLFDETSMVARVHLIEQIYDRLLSLNEGREESLPRVFVPIGYDPLITVTRDTYLHDVLYICGGKNIFAGHTQALAADSDNSDLIDRDRRYPRVTLADIEEVQPEIILLPDKPFPFTAEHVEIFRHLDIPAARNRRIHLVDGSILTWHGTRVAYAFDQLPMLLRLG